MIVGTFGLMFDAEKGRAGITFTGVLNTIREDSDYGSGRRYFKQWHSIE